MHCEGSLLAKKDFKNGLSGCIHRCLPASGAFAVYTVRRTFASKSRGRDRSRRLMKVAIASENKLVVARQPTAHGTLSRVTS